MRILAVILRVVGPISNSVKRNTVVTIPGRAIVLTEVKSKFQTPNFTLRLTSLHFPWGRQNGQMNRGHRRVAASETRDADFPCPHPSSCPGGKEGRNDDVTEFPPLTRNTFGQPHCELASHSTSRRPLPCGLPRGHPSFGVGLGQATD